MDDVLDLSLAELLEVIRALQERRANAFFRFDEALRESLNALEENPHNLRDSQLGYEAVVKKVTEDLTVLNDEAEQLESILAARSDGGDVLDLLRRIRKLDDECATAKISIHVLRRSAAAGLMPPEGGEEETIGMKTDEITRKLETILSDLNDLQSEAAEMQVELAEDGELPFVEGEEEKT